jgi:hypothetical protein
MLDSTNSKRAHDPLASVVLYVWWLLLRVQERNELKIYALVNDVQIYRIYLGLLTKELHEILSYCASGVLKKEKGEKYMRNE